MEEKTVIEKPEEKKVEEVSAASAVKKASSAKRKKDSTEEFNRNRRHYNRLYAFCWPFVWFFFNLFHPLRVLHRDRIPEGGALLCPNHTSNNDPVVALIASTRKGGVRAMSKQEILDIPVLGWYVKNVGAFGIRRGKADITAIKTAIRYLKAGDKVVMFPEGTRAKEGEDIEAKNGVAMIALKTGVPIVPIYIEPIKKKFKCTRVVYGEPFFPKIEGKRATESDYKACGLEWKRRVRELEAVEA